MKVLSRVAVIIAGSYLSACHPWLASQGETHSPFDPEKARQGQSPNPLKDTGQATTAPSPTPSASPTPSPRPFEKEALDLQTETGELSAERKLAIKLRKPIIIPIKSNPEAGENGQACYKLHLQQGTWSTAQPDESRFSCHVKYCAPAGKTGDVTLEAGTPYVFERREVYLGEADKNEHITFTRKKLRGHDELSQIESLECQGNSDGPTVGDLIDAFGVGDDKIDKISVEIQIDRLHSLPSATPSPRPSAHPSPRPHSSRQAAGQVFTEGRRLASANLSTQTMQMSAEESIESARPNFGLGLSVAPQAFGGSAISPASAGVSSQSFLLQAEYQPSFLQAIGVIGIGPSIGWYTMNGKSTATGGSATPTSFSLWEAGGQARYQMKYFENQWLVPYAGYDVQSLHYNVVEGGSGRVTLAGGNGGIAFLLNKLAPSEAREMYHSTGISRSYVTAEIKHLKGSDQNIRISGKSLFIGIRCEL